MRDKTKPTLILNGDILELALTTTNEAAMVFEQFIKLVMPRTNPFFERIIHIPGNHDHHLWEMARETQYTEYIAGIAPGDPLPVPYHTTGLFVEKAPKPLSSYFLSRLVNRFPHLKDFQIHVAYPNFGLIDPHKEKCVIFSHGHFIEPLYQLMSTLKNLIFAGRDKPVHIWEIEGR